MSQLNSEAAMLARLRELSHEDRAEFLRRVEASDATLAQRLAVIVDVPFGDIPSPALSARGGPDPLLGPTSAVAATRALAAALHSHETEIAGTAIGPYQLLQKIGEGGFGIVWMAEQNDPMHRRVALKIVKVGMDTEEVIARFEAERQALALMEHPNIAQVFDAGTTNAGRPYFVMELVRGIAITRYCDENRLSAPERLRLFITVCHAVQHAHHKGIIHRDLKPSNILVTLHDGIPVPKIIDFGIAKATQGPLTDKTLFTQFHAFIGTPAYTSPEQMEMSGLDVDTRSDIYSLGVLLYELLTGQLPFDSDALIKSGLDAMRRTIREIDPPRPSHRLGTLNELDRASAAQLRDTDATKLSLLLRGDLDWIAMRCLEKDRIRRYNSAGGLAADIERHLSDNPVEARPPSRVYRTKKFIRRHRLGVAAVAAVAASLIAGLIASSLLYMREHTARNRATSAEEKESDLRRHAEVTAAREVKRVARTALDLANQNLAEGRVADGLAYLVYAANKDPANTVLGPRLASALAAHNFLLPEATAFEGGSRVLALRFTNDGRSIYVGTEDGTFRVLDAISGQLKNEVRLNQSVTLGGWEFPRNNDAVFAVRFADDTFGVYDVESGRARRAPLAFPAIVRKDDGYLGLGQGAGISPDGRWIYALANTRFWIWNAMTGELVLQPESVPLIGSCDFSCDGSELAIVLGGTVQRWALPGGKPITTALSSEDLRPTHATIIRYSPDGRHIALSTFFGIWIFDAKTGALVQKMPPPGDYINSPSLAFASNTRVFGAGHHASGSWDLAKGEFTPVPIGLGADVISATFDAAGRRVLAVGSDGFARVCDLKSGELVAAPAWRQRRIFCAALSPDGVSVAFGTSNGTVQRYRVGLGAARPLVLSRRILKNYTPVPTIPVPFLPELPTRLLWLTGDRAEIIDAVAGRKLEGGFALPQPVLPTSWMAWDSPVRSDAKFMVVRTPKGWQAWELGPNGVIHVAPLEKSEDAAGPIRFSPKGDLAALRFFRTVGEVGKLAVWNLRNGTRAGPEFTHPSALVDMSPNFSPDGSRLALGTADGACMIIEVATGLTVLNFSTRPLVPNPSVWFSPDGTRVFTSNVRSETRIWDSATGKAVSPIIDAENWWGGARYFPNGKWFATWGLHMTRLWDGQTGAPIGEAIPAGGRMIRFSQDSRNVGTADDSGFAQVWDAPSGHAFTEPMRFSKGRLGLINSSPEFSPTARFLRTQSSQEFCVFSIPPRLPEGTRVPPWLLRLATVLATKIVNDQVQLVDLVDPLAQFHDARREVMALPADAPLAEWGRWVLDDRPDRPIAPGFTATPADAEKLAASLAADLAAQP